MFSQKLFWKGIEPISYFKFQFPPESEINQFVEIALLILSLEISETIEEVLETFAEIEYQKYEKEGMVSSFILIE